MSAGLRAEEQSEQPAAQIVLPPVPDVKVDLSPGPGETAKGETSQGDAAKGEAAKSEAAKSEAAKSEVAPRQAEHDAGTEGHKPGADAKAATLDAPETAPLTTGTTEVPPAPGPATEQAVAPPAAAPVPAAREPSWQPAATAAQTKPAEDGEAIAKAIAAAREAYAQEPAKTVAARREREALIDFYVARNDQPVWRIDGAWTPAARSALQRLEHADEDALDLRDTPLPTLRGSSPAEIAATDLALSRAVVNYGREASGSRIDPLTISRLITEKPDIPDVARILTAVSTTEDAGSVLQGFNPDREAYRRLRTKLAELRQTRNDPAAARIDSGPVLKVGMKDPRVPLIRAHFKLASAATTTSDELVYDMRVASAVKHFQRENGLPASGLLTARTVAVLSGGQPAALEAEIIANMERLRWLPHEAPPDRIEVNIPDYTVRVFHDNEVIHTARVIVGKPTTPTPIFSNTMKFLEVNPYWNVPDSIIKKEMLPKLAADPTYLTRMGYEVKTVRGRLVVRQPPGDRNALGHIKFMFPNQHAVYLHDTPTRGLFKTQRRAYSHGCVRVDDPFKLAEIVLGKSHGWNEAKVKSLVGKGNRTIHLPKPLDIDIGYFTAFVDDAGKLQLRDDVYGYSRKVKAALGLEG